MRACSPVQQLSPVRPGLDPQTEARQQLRQLIGAARAQTGARSLPELMRNLDPATRRVLRQLLRLARGGAPGQLGAGPLAAGPRACGAMPAGAPMMPGPMMPAGAPMMPAATAPMMPGAPAIPGAVGQTGASQADAVRARVAEAGNRLEAATGLRVPTTVVNDGAKNGMAYAGHNTVHTGVTPDAAPGVKFHEDAHVLLGDTVNPQGTTMQRELRADQIAGYLLVKSGYGQREIEAFIREVMSVAGGDHGTPDQRATAVLMGVNQALAEQGVR